MPPSPPRRPTSESHSKGLYNPVVGIQITGEGIEHKPSSVGFDLALILFRCTTVFESEITGLHRAGTTAVPTQVRTSDVNIRVFAGGLPGARLGGVYSGGAHFRQQGGLWGQKD